MKTVMFAALLMLSLGACASMRNADVTSNANPTYRISVHNARAGAVTVSYSDGNTTRELGQVGGGETVPFVVVTSNGSTRITVTARTAGGTTLAPRSVTLSQGGTTQVTIN